MARPSDPFIGWGREVVSPEVGSTLVVECGFNRNVFAKVRQQSAGCKREKVGAW
jgi:hypothetical protein